MAIGKTNMGLPTVWRVTPLSGSPIYASTKEEADKLEKPDQSASYRDGENV